LRVFISVDMEGVSGVCTEQQTSLTGDRYREACALMRADLDAADQTPFIGPLLMLVP
jgi:D-aminopeptidase